MTNCGHSECSEESQKDLSHSFKMTADSFKMTADVSLSLNMTSRHSECSEESQKDLSHSFKMTTDVSLSPNMTVCVPNTL